MLSYSYIKSQNVIVSVALFALVSACEMPVSKFSTSTSSSEINPSNPSGGTNTTTPGGGTSNGGGTTDGQPANDGPTQPWDFPYDDGANPYFRATNTFTVVNKAKQVDVLFVMDDSGSMAEEQQSVVNSFSTFLQGFTAERIDYHIGIVATDSVNNQAWWTAQNGAYRHFPNVGPGSLLAYEGSPRFMDTSLGRDETIREFRQNALLGTQGSGSETGLLTATLALGPTLNGASAWNAGFIRPDAMLSVVIVSDEDESMGNTDTRYIKNVDPTGEQARIDNFVSRLKDLKPNRPDLIRADFVISPVGQNCTTAAAKGETYTKAYNKLYEGASQPAGKILNICSDFSKDLGDLGAQIAVQAERRFKITKNVEGELVVKLDGVTLSVSSSEGYTYNASTSEIEIHGLDLESKDGYVVEATFVALK